MQRLDVAEFIGEVLTELDNLPDGFEQRLVELAYGTTKLDRDYPDLVLWSHTVTAGRMEFCHPTIMLGTGFQAIGW